MTAPLTLSAGFVPVRMPIPGGFVHPSVTFDGVSLRPFLYPVFLSEQKVKNTSHTILSDEITNSQLSL